MFRSLGHFLKYNNATVLILVLIFVVSGGAFAQTEAGRELIGEKETSVSGVDNTLLVEADLDNFNMDYRIERIETDGEEKYYFITYTFLDLMDQNGAWQYVMQEKTRKVSAVYQGDLGEYLAEELSEEYNARLKALRAEQALARADGPTQRIEVELYSGLVGSALELTGKVFAGYEPVKVKTLPGPSAPERLAMLGAGDPTISASAGAADNLVSIYDEYMERMDADRDGLIGVMDNCADAYNPSQKDTDNDGLGDACDPDFAPIADPGAEDGADSTAEAETGASEEPALIEPTTDETRETDAAEGQSPELPPDTEADDPQNAEAADEAPADEPKVIIIRPGEVE